MIEAEDLQCLKAIALIGGCKGPVLVSSQTLAGTLGISPQTASRRLIALEAGLLITRSLHPDGQYVAVTRDGEEALHREYSDYCRVFERKAAQFQLNGIVVSGVGEGRYYVSLPHYREQFSKMLGFSPFPGTLNIRLNRPSVQVRKKLESVDWVPIEGFTADDRTFGEARALPCSIQGYRCAIVVPGRTHYPDDVIEVIAAEGLRETLKLKDMDMVTVEVLDD